MTWTLVDVRGILEVLVENFVFAARVLAGSARGLRGECVLMAVDRDGDGGRGGGDGMGNEAGGVRNERCELRGDGVRNEVGGVRDDGDGVRGDKDGVLGDVNSVLDGWTSARNRRAVEGFVPWIFAVAEDAEEAWWERRKRNPKKMGELSQAAFLMKAQSLGFGLAVPWGDSEKCDFIVWAGPGGRLLRVQVKATGRLHRGGYDVQPVYSTRGEGKKVYTAEDIDVLAAHVVIKKSGKEVWYLLPVEALRGVKSLRFFPEWKGRNPRWERYREAWRWLGLER